MSAYTIELNHCPVVGDDFASPCDTNGRVPAYCRTYERTRHMMNGTTTVSRPVHRIDMRLPPAAFRRLQQLAQQDGASPGTTARRLVLHGVMRELRTVSGSGEGPNAR